MNTPKLAARTAHSDAVTTEQAVRELALQLGEGLAGVLVFASAASDLASLGPALKRAFACPVTGCTSSGQLDATGFRKGGITAVGLASDAITMTPFFITPLSESLAGAERVAAEVRAIQKLRPSRRAFGLILVDGLSLAEDRLTAALYRALGDVPIVGGSAGDDLAFRQTHVLVDGTFRSDAAVFVLFDTMLPFHTFRFQHFVPTDKKLVITRSDAEKRIVHEIDGRPAAEAYAELIGVPVDRLEARVFARHPVMLRLGNEYYVRSIQKLGADGSMHFLCALEEGLVLTIGQGVDAVESAERAFGDVRRKIPDPALVIGCDCILRRLELEHEGLDEAVGKVFADNRVVGFSTYGEQFDAVHVNQTFTGIAIGG